MTLHNRRYIHVLFGFVLFVQAFFLIPQTAYSKYGGHKASDPYLSWADANVLYGSLNGTTESQSSPHGGYTQTSVKCMVCHSAHRASSSQDELELSGVGEDWSLLNGAGKSCAACHAAWGASPSNSIIEIGQYVSGPHIGADGSTCTKSGCHGSVHGNGAPSKYAVAVKYNLTNGTLGLLDTSIDEAIASGNVNPSISLDSTSPQMRAFVTGYVCFPCHGEVSRSVAVVGHNGGTEAVYRTGHASSTASIPSCDTCHDMVGVATGTTAWPHANRGIEVYKGRFNGLTSVVSTQTIKPDGTDATRFGLWMTAGNFGDNKNAIPLSGAIADSKEDWESAEGELIKAKQNINKMLTDGVCIKCHKPSGLR